LAKQNGDKAFALERTAFFEARDFGFGQGFESGGSKLPRASRLYAAL
jgi:hypothetical protein